MPNLLSYIGKINYFGMLALYGIAGTGYFLYLKPYLNKKKQRLEEEDLKKIEYPEMDIKMHSALTPVPFHHNSELLHRYEGINMYNYLNENHINEENYPYQRYYSVCDVLDHGPFIYNWSGNLPRLRPVPPTQST